MLQIKYKKETAVADKSEAMETVNISKNLTSRKKFNPFRYALLLTASLMICSISCKKDKDEPNDTNKAGTYLGIIAFNNTLEERKITLLDNATVSEYKLFIQDKEMGNNTALFKAVYTATQRLENATIPKKLVNVSIITFTDGLDNVSHNEPPFKNDAEAYSENLAIVTKRIKELKVGGLPINAYSIGLLGKSGGGGADKLSATLNGLASKPENVKMSENMDEINAKFEEIAKSLREETKNQSVDIVIPRPANNQKIRITFDNVNENSVANSTLYFEGTYNNSGTTKKDALASIKSDGLKFGKIEVVVIDNNTAKLLVNKLELKDSKDDVPLKDINMWKYIQSESKWEEEIEFDGKSTTISEVEEMSSLVILVLDCSNSLDDDFPLMQKSAKDFIDILLSKSGETGGGGTEVVDIELVYVKTNYTMTSEDFYIGKYPVTQKEWFAVMGTNPSYFKGDNLPVETVSLYDAQEFISKLNAKTGKKYRLPTESEWEYAARGGNKSQGYEYSGSNNINTVAWYDENSGNSTKPVGTKQPNELGIYDMSGNVREWCYFDYWVKQVEECPLRGGSWDGIAQYCRVSNRYFSLPDFRDYRHGFRVVIVP
jgi:hypothetical protein